MTLQVPSDPASAGAAGNAEAPLPEALGHPGKTTAAWWRQLTGYHWFVFLVASAAWFFDCLDQRIFSLARIPALNAINAVSSSPATDQGVQNFGKVVTACFLVGWGVGGLIFGALGDKFGRARMLTITILIYSAFTGLTFFSNTWFDFTAYRFMTGLGVGGVFGLAVALIAETVPSGARAQSLGMLQILSTIGNIAAGFVQKGADALESGGIIATSTGWRWMFLVGAIPALMVILTGRWLREPEPWLKLKREDLLPKGSIFQPYHKLFREQRWRKNLIVGACIASTGVVGLWAIGEYAVDLQRQMLRNYFAPEVPRQLAAPATFVGGPGGAISLVYDLKPAADTPVNPALADDTLRILQHRIDPNGVQNIGWRPRNPTQIEVLLPLADSRELDRLQHALADARAKLEATNIDLKAATAWVAKGPERDAKELDRFAVGSAMRRQLLQEAAAAQDISQKKVEPGDPDYEKVLREQVAAETRLAEFPHALAVSNVSIAVVDRAIGQHDSARREREFAALKNNPAAPPARAAMIDQYVAARFAYDTGGTANLADLKRLLRRNGVLEFHILVMPSEAALTDSRHPQGFSDWQKELTREGPEGKPGDRFQWREVDDAETFRGHAFMSEGRWWVLADMSSAASLDHHSGAWSLRSAQPRMDRPSGQQVIEFEFDEAGAALLSKLTSANVGRPMGIFLDGHLLSAPNINGPITGGVGIISGGGKGGFSRSEIDYLVTTLLAGALPVAMSNDPISEQVVPPHTGPVRTKEQVAAEQAKLDKARNQELDKRGKPVVFLAYILNMLGAALGMWLFARLANAAGRRVAFLCGFSAALVITVFVYWRMTTPTDAYWMMFLMGAAQLSVFAGFAIYLPELFPSSLRSTGTSFCYNLGRFAAAGGSLISAYVSDALRNVVAPNDPTSTLPFRYSAIIMCSLFLVGLLTLPFAPETRGKPLPE